MEAAITVNAVQHYGHYGNVSDASPNKLYKKYLVWFGEKYAQTETPLTFKEWLQWAQKKGLAQERVLSTQERILNADGDNAPEEEEVAVEVNNNGRRIAIALGCAAFLAGLYFGLKTQTV